MGKPTSSRADRAQEARGKAVADGLLRASGNDAAFLKSLGIGEERPTAYFYSVKNKIRSHAEWWAPAEVVRLNTYMSNAGLSSKLRAKALRSLAEGKELAPRLADVVASYTEGLLSRG